MSSTILIYNRGEIALRAARSAKACNLESVIILQEGDFSNLLEKNCDKVIYSDHKSIYTDLNYLDHFLTDNSIDFLYPGYGYLSEDPKLEILCRKHNVCFLGPNQHCLELLSDKKRAGELFNSWGINTLNIKTPKSSDYPLMLKAAMGGGGRGNLIVDDPQFLEESLSKLKKKSIQLFQNDTILFERYLPTARHIEIQAFATDQFVSIIGSRDCSLQINYQKVIEEGPISKETLEKVQLLYPSIEKGLKDIGYKGLGTIEFLWDSERLEIYFLEMNTRIQVEHTVTEELLSVNEKVNLVEKQIQIFQDSADLTHDLSSVKNLKEIGHAINLRIYAVNTNDNFKPEQGKLHFVEIPNHVRFDHTITVNERLSSVFDPLLGKLVSTGNNRIECINNAIKDLKTIKVHGVKTNKYFLLETLNDVNFQNNKHTISYLENKINEKQSIKLVNLQEIRLLFNEKNLQEKALYKDFTVTLAANGKLWIENNETLELRVEDFYPSITRGEKSNISLEHVTSPVTGVVREVTRRAFDNVNKGDIILTIESMKMFFEVEAPKAGTLQEFSLKAGSNVNSGEILIRID